MEEDASLWFSRVERIVEWGRMNPFEDVSYAARLMESVLMRGRLLSDSQKVQVMKLIHRHGIGLQ